jgi:hypothetical protein
LVTGKHSMDSMKRTFGEPAGKGFGDVLFFVVVMQWKNAGIKPFNSYTARHPAAALGFDSFEFNDGVFAICDPAGHA